MNNEPVAWMYNYENFPDSFVVCRARKSDQDIPLYTHPVKELHLSLQKDKETGELLAVTYTDDEHRIVEVLWQRPPVKELTDEEIEQVRVTIMGVAYWCADENMPEAYNAVKVCCSQVLQILEKAQ